MRFWYKDQTGKKSPQSYCECLGEHWLGWEMSERHLRCGVSHHSSWAVTEDTVVCASAYQWPSGVDSLSG